MVIAAGVDVVVAISVAVVISLDTF